MASRSPRAAADAAYVEAEEALRVATASMAAAARAALLCDDSAAAESARTRLRAALARAKGALRALRVLLTAKLAAEAEEENEVWPFLPPTLCIARTLLHVRGRRARPHTPRARAQATRSSGVSILSLPDELLLRCLAPLPPPLRRLHAAAVCRRFKRLLYTPALRAALLRAHMLPQGASLAPGESLTSPDGRFRFTLEARGASIALYYSPQRHARGADETRIWTLSFICWPRAVRLLLHALAGALYAFNPFGDPRWSSS